MSFLRPEETLLLEYEGRTDEDARDNGKDDTNNLLRVGSCYGRGNVGWQEAYTMLESEHIPSTPQMHRIQTLRLPGALSSPVEEAETEGEVVVVDIVVRTRYTTGASS